MSGELQEGEYPVSLKSNKAIEAMWYAIVLWIIGFVWGHDSLHDPSVEEHVINLSYFETACSKRCSTVALPSDALVSCPTLLGLDQ